MAKIFLSYRRDDSQYVAHQIRDRLAARFGEAAVVFDIDSIPLAADFPTYIRDSVAQCDVLLALIGTEWLEEINRRRDDPIDWVRIEVAEGLKQNKVLPVLIGGARMPTESELPSELTALQNKMATEVRGGRDLNAHLDRIVSDLEQYFAARGTSTIAPQYQAASNPSRVKPESSRTYSAKELMIAFGYLVFALVGWWVCRTFIYSISQSEQAASFAAAISSLFGFVLGMWLRNARDPKIGEIERLLYGAGVLVAFILFFAQVS